MPLFPLISFASSESTVSSQKRGRSGRSVHLGAGILSQSPMDEGSIEPCGRVTSKTHIYKAFQVDNMLMSPNEIVSGEISNLGDIGMG